MYDARLCLWHYASSGDDMDLRWNEVRWLTMVIGLAAASLLVFLDTHTHKRRREVTYDEQEIWKGDEKRDEPNGEKRTWRS